MPTTLECMKFSLNVYAAIVKNSIALPFGWCRNNWQPDLASGFSAGTFVKGNDVVISCKGTNDYKITNDGGDAVNWSIGFGIPTAQLYQAIDYYFAQKAAYPEANITFTGHSLGGGMYYEEDSPAAKDATKQLLPLSLVASRLTWPMSYRIFKLLKPKARL